MNDAVFNINDLIQANRDNYSYQKSIGSKKVQISDLNQSININRLIKGNEMLYQQNSSRHSNSNKQKSRDNLDQPLKREDINSNILEKTNIQEISRMIGIYNYKTLIRKGGMFIQGAQDLDQITIQRREREKAQREQNLFEEGSSLIQRGLNSKKNKIFQPYKYYISKLLFDDQGAKIFAVDLNDEDKKVYIATLNPVDFGVKRPSQSIVQDKFTGRYFVYDNNTGKILIYSPEILKNPLKDRPLIAMNMDEDPPRQDPLMFLYEDIQNEVQRRSILMMVGGYQKGKGKKVRPLKTIKVFQVNKRDVSLTPITTISMQYPRMHPVVFVVVRNKVVFTLNRRVYYGKSLPLNLKRGNILTEQILQDNSDISENLINANKTCEYIGIKQILDYITRAQSINQQENVLTDDLQGMNYKKFQLQDTFNIKYQNNSRHTQRVYDSLHHACVIKQVDEVFEGEQFYIIGGNSPIILQISAISPQTNELNLQPSNLYTQKVTYIHSKCMIKTFKQQMFFMTDGRESGIHCLGMLEGSKKSFDKKISCACEIM